MYKQMKWLCLLMVVMVLSFSSVSPLKKEEPSSAAGGSQLNSKIAKVLSHPDLKGASIGISVRNASNGKIIYKHNGDTRLRPASSMKLVTGAAALQLFVENDPANTEIYTDGKQN